MNNNLIALVIIVLISSCITRNKPTIEKQEMNEKSVILDSLEMIKYVINREDRAANIHTYVLNHLQYPISARKKKIEGIVLLRYQIDMDSTVKIKVVNGITEECDKEAIRVLRSALLHHFDTNFVGQIVLTSVPFRLPSSSEK